MTRHSRLAVLVLLCCTCVAWATEFTYVSIPDVEVVTDTGKTMRFSSDLLKTTPVAVVTFVFTTCDGVCPMQGRSLAALQASLSDRLGRDVQLVSISVDPEVDTPARLKSWRRQFGALPGWTLVTGQKTTLQKLTAAFPGVPASKGEHYPVAYVGSPRTGKWIRAYGLSSPDVFGGYIDQVRNTAQSSER
jgi:protein SCO1